MKELWSRTADMFKMMTIYDFIDILAVGVLIFLAYRFISGRRAGKLAVGIAVIIFLSIASNVFHLNTMSFLFSNLFQVGIIAIIIVFQPELRSALEKMGGVKEYINHVSLNKSEKHLADCIDIVCDAVCDMALDKTGALIVFERSTKLGDIIKSGTLINADLSVNLIKNIFYKNSPLHDGAMVIRDNRIISAKCMLPLSTKSSMDSEEFATRHRAAIGMSENSDAVVVVVSEQTGIISITYGGNIDRDYDYRKLHDALLHFLTQTPAQNPNGERKGGFLPKKKQKNVKGDQSGQE